MVKIKSKDRFEKLRSLVFQNCPCFRPNLTKDMGQTIKGPFFKCSTSNILPGASGGNIGVVLQPGPRVTVRDQAGVVVVVVPSPSSRTRTISTSIAAQQVPPLLYQALGPTREVLVRSVLTSQLIYMLSQSCSLNKNDSHVNSASLANNQV